MRCMRAVLVPEETSLTRLLQARRVYYGEGSSLCKTPPPVVRVSRVIAKGCLDKRHWYGKKGRNREERREEQRQRRRCDSIDVHLPWQVKRGEEGEKGGGKRKRSTRVKDGDGWNVCSGGNEIDFSPNSGTNSTITETTNEIPSNVTDKKTGNAAERASEAEEIRQETARTSRLSVLSHGIGSRATRRKSDEIKKRLRTTPVTDDPAGSGRLGAYPSRVHPVPRIKSGRTRESMKRRSATDKTSVGAVPASGWIIPIKIPVLGTMERHGMADGMAGWMTTRRVRRDPSQAPKEFIKQYLGSDSTSRSYFDPSPKCWELDFTLRTSFSTLDPILRIRILILDRRLTSEPRAFWRSSVAKYNDDATTYPESSEVCLHEFANIAIEGTYNITISHVNCNVSKNLPCLTTETRIRIDDGLN
ncbi:hypothetical protein WN48_06371 [Eufriesea mexicana]|uniref:Uncharacterized protein n=1 Tax=Eufriesea mexicana TaxID=516756 RepID=A0A310SC58_9HYME|nr:hypothetical protein WN48_06371 [Eufriesea mexicana]